MMKRSTFFRPVVVATKSIILNQTSAVSFSNPNHNWVGFVPKPNQTLSLKHNLDLLEINNQRKMQ